MGKLKTRGLNRVLLGVTLATSLVATMAFALSLTPGGSRLLRGLATTGASYRLAPWAPVFALADTTCTPPPNTNGGGTSPPPNTSGGGTSPPPNTSGGGTSPPPNTSGGGTSPPPNTSGGGTSPPPNTSGGGICPPPTPPPQPVVAVVLMPATAINPAETNHTVTATVTVNGQPAAGVTVQFIVTNAATSAVITIGSCVTDAAGQCMFTYAGPSTLTARSDTIQGCATTAGVTNCGTATKTWVVTCQQLQQQFLADIQQLEAAGEEPPADLVKKTLDDLVALLKAGCQLPPLPCVVDSDMGGDWQAVVDDWWQQDNEMKTDFGELVVDAFLQACEPDEDDGHDNGNHDQD
jgi:hypothetical protein